MCGKDLAYNFQNWMIAPTQILTNDGTLRWRHNGRNGVSNHQPHDCLLNSLFRRRSKKTSKLRVTGLCVGNSPWTGEFPAQMASNAENVSIWWRHHAGCLCFVLLEMLRFNFAHPILTYDIGAWLWSTVKVIHCAVMKYRWAKSVSNMYIWSNHFHMKVTLIYTIINRVCAKLALT